VGYSLALAAVIAPPLAVFAPLGLAPLLAVLAVALYVTDGRRCLAGMRCLVLPATLLASLSLWGALSAAWSPIALHSLLESGRLLLIGMAGLVVLGSAMSLDAATRERIGGAAVVGAALALVLLQLELNDGQMLTRLLRLDDGPSVPLSRYDRGVVALLLATWPAVAVIAWRRGGWVAGAAAAVVLLTLFEFRSQAAMLAALNGLVAGAVAWRWPRSVAAMLVGGVALLAFALPLTTPGGRTIQALHERFPQTKDSAAHRLVIWRFTADRIADRPIFGWGMDASRALPGGAAEVDEVMPEVKLHGFAQVLPLHPHDAALQWRVELGLPGTLLCLAFLAQALWRVARDRTIESWHRGVALGFAAAALTIAMLSFGAWQAWWLSALWLFAGLLAATLPPGVTPRTSAAEKPRAP
jgi:exopolysaccharide production protein ExoQ